MPVRAEPRLVLVRRLLNWWPDGTESLERQRWITALHALTLLLLLWTGMTVSGTSGGDIARYILGLLFAVAAAVYYRMNMGLYSLVDEHGLRVRQVLTWEEEAHPWSSVEGVGIAQVYAPSPFAAIGVRLHNGRTIVLPSTLSRRSSRRLVAQVKTVEQTYDVEYLGDLGTFGPLMRSKDRGKGQAPQA